MVSCLTFAIATAGPPVLGSLACAGFAELLADVVANTTDFQVGVIELVSPIAGLVGFYFGTFVGYLLGKKIAAGEKP
jgi:hypothetical protein